MKNKTAINIAVLCYRFATRATNAGHPNVFLILDSDNRFVFAIIIFYLKLAKIS